MEKQREEFRSVSREIERERDVEKRIPIVYKGMKIGWILLDFEG